MTYIQTNIVDLQEKVNVWVKEDITGLASGIEYAKKGDQVMVVDDCRELILVKKGETMFFCKPEKLSSEKVNPDPVNQEKQPVKKRK